MILGNHNSQLFASASTVEPVFGTLTQFMGLRKINTIGIQQANKVMHLSAIAYNLKKYLKFITKKVKSDAGMLHVYLKALKHALGIKTKPILAF